MPVKDEEESVESLSELIAERGLKFTRQRSVITQALFASRDHMTVEELWSQVRITDPRISVATVYRTMKLLTESGLARPRDFGGQTQYERALGKDHSHLICTGCGDIIEFESERIESLQQNVARHHGFKVQSHKLEMYGLCAGCRRDA